MLLFWNYIKWSKTNQQHSNITNHYFSLDRTDRNIKYYDGKVLGKEEIIYGSVNELENNKKISISAETIDEQEYKASQLIEESNESEIAQIGETTHRTVTSLK